MQILAFDPGETTGVALLNTRAREIYTNCYKFPDELYSFLGQTTFDHVTHIVIEQFILYAHKAQSKSWSKFPEIRAQGAIEYVAHTTQTPFTLQTASVAKQAISNSFLRSKGLYTLAHNAHERDALRHAITYLLRFEKKELQKWFQLQA